MAQLEEIHGKPVYVAPCWSWLVVAAGCFLPGDYYRLTSGVPAIVYGEITAANAGRCEYRRRSELVCLHGSLGGAALLAVQFGRPAINHGGVDDQPGWLALI